MSQTSAHCPFLNRSDERCSEFFSLDRLQHAFKFCFDHYTSCPVYNEQLAERQFRRQGVVRHATPVFVDLTVSTGRFVRAAESGSAGHAQRQHAAA